MYVIFSDHMKSYVNQKILSFAFQHLLFQIISPFRELQVVVIVGIRSLQSQLNVIQLVLFEAQLVHHFLIPLLINFAKKLISAL